MSWGLLQGSGHSHEVFVPGTLLQVLLGQRAGSEAATWVQMTGSVLYKSFLVPRLNRLGLCHILAVSSGDSQEIC